MDSVLNIRRDWIILAVLAALTVGLYWQVAGFSFINYDDQDYVYENPAVRFGLRSITARWAFTTTACANYHPLTWISLMVDTDLGKIATWVFDADLGKDNAGIYHLTNMALHVANTLVLFVLLTAMTGFRWRAAFVAALFAVHPMHIESVAWVSERKDVLSTLFWLLTMLAYVAYTREPSLKRYLLIVLAFVLGLLAKPMLVTLPIVLLLMDIWPLRRVVWTAEDGEGLSAAALIREKIPLFVITLASCVATFIAQRLGGAVGSLSDYSLSVRAANALVVCVVYIKKLFWPTGMTIPYPHPGTGLPVWQVAASAVFLVLATLIAIRLSKRAPYVAVGWLWYVITLIPVIGIVQVGRQAMADRYTYIPYLGLFLIVAWGIPELLAKRGGALRSAGLSFLALASVLALSAAAYPAIGYWRDGRTLFTQAVRVCPKSPDAHFNLGKALEDQSDTEAAVEHYRMAVRLRPDYVDAHYNLGCLLAGLGKEAEAVQEFQRTIAIFPGHSRAYNSIGSVLALGGRVREALPYFAKAARLDPSYAEAQRNLKSARSVLAGEAPDP